MLVFFHWNILRTNEKALEDEIKHLRMENPILKKISRVSFEEMSKQMWSFEQLNLWEFVFNHFYL